MKPLVLILLSFLLGTSSFCQSNMLLLKKTGKVVIGDTAVIKTPGTYSLYVQNGMLTERVKVSLKNTTEWSDDAFSKTPSIDAVVKSISSDSHLVEMPSAASLVKDGYELKEMDAKILQQVEWLWQHVILLTEENKKLQQEVIDLKSKLK
jgi:trimeric autotransporter adhesin